MPATAGSHCGHRRTPRGRRPATTRRPAARLLNAGGVLREARYLTFARDRHAQLTDPAGQDALAVDLQEREPVVVPSGKVAGIEQDPGERSGSAAPAPPRGTDRRCRADRAPRSCASADRARASCRAPTSSPRRSTVATSAPAKRQLSPQHHPRRSASGDHHTVPGHTPPASFPEFCFEWRFCASIRSLPQAPCARYLEEGGG